MSWQGGPVNWDLAKNVARHTVVAEGDPSVLDVDRQKVVDALRLADLWLDEVTAFPSGVRSAQAWSRSEWVEATLPVWSKLCDPIAEKAVDAMGGMLADGSGRTGGELPGELNQALQAVTGGMGGLGALGSMGGLGAMMRRIGGMMVGGQTGAAVGALAREVVSSTDVGLPLGPEGTAALLPAGRRRRSARGCRSTRTRSGSSWPCGRPRTTGCSLTCRGCGRTGCWPRSRTTPGASPWTPRRCARPCRRSTRPTRRRCATHWPARPVPARGHAAAEGRAVPAGDRCWRWSRAGWPPWSSAAATGPAATGRARSPRPSAGAAPPAARPSRRSPPWSASNSGRARSARGRRAVAAASPRRGVADGRDAVWSHPDLLPTAEDLDDPAGFVAGRRNSTCPPWTRRSRRSRRPDADADADADADEAKPDDHGPGDAGPGADGPEAGGSELVPGPGPEARRGPGTDPDPRYPASRVRSVVIALHRRRRKLPVIHRQCTEYYLVGRR